MFKFYFTEDLENLLFSLDGRTDLADEIVNAANNLSQEKNLIRVGSLNNQKFSDNELCVDFIDSVRGKRVYILSSPNSSDEIMKLNLAIDAAKRGAAKEIIPILPYFPYARQDKKDQARGPIGAKIIAEMLEQRGATSVITFDLHADQIQGFFNIPITHLAGKNVFDDYINELCGFKNAVDKNIHATNTNYILCGPDAGSGKRVKRMQKQLLKKYNLSLNYVMLDKTRTEANKVDEMVIIGDVKDKHVIILDDMVDTAGTLCKAAEVLIDAGARSVRAVISHPVLSGPAYERIGESKLTELIVSDSLRIKHFEAGGFLDGVNNDCVAGEEKIKVVSVSHQIGFAVAAINNQVSYEALKEQYYANL